MFHRGLCSSSSTRKCRTPQGLRTTAPDRTPTNLLSGSTAARSVVATRTAPSLRSLNVLTQVRTQYRPPASPQRFRAPGLASGEPLGRRSPGPGFWCVRAGDLRGGDRGMERRGLLLACASRHKPARPIGPVCESVFQARARSSRRGAPRSRRTARRCPIRRVMRGAA